MITEHKALLGKIQEAQKEALGLSNKGEAVARIVQNLRSASDETRQRIDYYEREERSKPAKAPKQAAPKGEKAMPETSNAATGNN